MVSKEVEEALEEVGGLRGQIGICLHTRRSKRVPEIFYPTSARFQKPSAPPLISRNRIRMNSAKNTN